MVWRALQAVCVTLGEPRIDLMQLSIGGQQLMRSLLENAGPRFMPILSFE